jgi:glycosyltransferase involved in cell wall biosynthesis
VAEGLDRVDVLGFVPDLAAELGRARLGLAPIWVGGGTRIKVLEALAAARPVVGTALGVEQIGFADGEHGLVADDDRGLADACVALLADAALGRRLGLAGRDLAEGYRWRTATEPLEDAYRELLAAASPAATGTAAPGPGLAAGRPRA